MNRYLQHHGVKGMKWGVRRYQNEDGTLTDQGKSRYGDTAKKVATVAAGAAIAVGAAYMVKKRNTQLVAEMTKRTRKVGEQAYNNHIKAKKLGLDRMESLGRNFDSLHSETRKQYVKDAVKNFDYSDSEFNIYSNAEKRLNSKEPFSIDERVRYMSAAKKRSTDNAGKVAASMSKKDKERLRSSIGGRAWYDTLMKSMYQTDNLDEMDKFTRELLRKNNEMLR